MFDASPPLSPSLSPRPSHAPKRSRVGSDAEQKAQGDATPVRAPESETPGLALDALNLRIDLKTSGSPGFSALSASPRSPLRRVMDEAVRCEDSLDMLRRQLSRRAARVIAGSTPASPQPHPQSARQTQHLLRAAAAESASEFGVPAEPLPASAVPTSASSRALAGRSRSLPAFSDTARASPPMPGRSLASHRAGILGDWASSSTGASHRTALSLLKEADPFTAGASASALSSALSPSVAPSLLLPLFPALVPPAALLPAQASSTLAPPTQAPPTQAPLTPPTPLAQGEAQPGPPPPKT
jgi:hypothetical protein